MNSPVLTRKALFGFLIAACLILVFVFIWQCLDRRTRIVFCDVGQGNAAYVRIDDTDILIDTGPVKGSALTCLGAHMPFFDRTIEYLIISHPQADHDGGASEIIRRYSVQHIIFAASFRNHPHVKQFERIAPTAQFIFVRNNLRIGLPRRVQMDLMAAAQSSPTSADDNDKSLIVSVITIGRQFLFTGDISATILSSLTHTYISNKLILEVPHHGSAHGLSEYFLKTVRPVLGIISVGRKNSYGHPAAYTLELLKKNNIPYKRTDKEGDIVFIDN